MMHIFFGRQIQVLSSNKNQVLIPSYYMMNSRRKARFFKPSKDCEKMEFHKRKNNIHPKIPITATTIAIIHPSVRLTPGIPGPEAHKPGTGVGASLADGHGSTPARGRRHDSPRPRPPAPRPGGPGQVLREPDLPGARRRPRHALQLRAVRALRADLRRGGPVLGRQTEPDVQLGRGAAGGLSADADSAARPHAHAAHQDCSGNGSLCPDDFFKY